MCGPDWLTDEPLYSSNSLESSSISVYARLIPETGRSSEDRTVRCEEKRESLFFPLRALSNISTPDSNGVMGVMACCRVVSIS